jgi:TRAP-type C4-dicarboxylate transport system permease small subunit
MRALGKLNFGAGVLGAVLTVAMAAIVLYDVFRRYVLNDPTIWAFDIASFLLVYIIFLGLGLALQDGSHVSVDLFLDLTRGRTRRTLRLVGLILTTLYGAILTWVISRYTMQAIGEDWKAISLVPIPLKYVYVVGPVGSLLFTLTAIVLTIRLLRSDE